MTKEKPRLDTRQSHPCTVRALQDCDCVTHTLKKGMITTMLSDHAAALIDEGKVELVSEQAVTEATGKEKRVDK
jgi:hypothetical protein